MADLYGAFYRGRGRFWADTMVRRFTGARFSHCELVRADAPPGCGDTALCLGASLRDGGVRVKEITFDAGKWEMLPLPWAPDDAWERAEAFIGLEYDRVAILLSNILQLERHREDAWTCSELLAHALGLDRAQRYDPGLVFRHARRRTRQWWNDHDEVDGAVIRI